MASAIKKKGRAAVMTGEASGPGRLGKIYLVDVDLEDEEKTPGTENSENED